MFLGVKVVLAKSFQRIHTDNLVNFGILPLTFANEKDYDGIAVGDELEIADVPRALKEGTPLAVRNLTRNTTIAANQNLSERQKEIILAGGVLTMRKQKAGR
jgi:aconitate hydratase